MRIEGLPLAFALLFVVAGCANRAQTHTEAAPQPRENYLPLMHQTVAIITTNRVVFVSGEVKKPDRFIWGDGLTLTQAIQMAGGFTEFANRSRLELRRSDGSLELFSYAGILRGGADNPVLRPNDQVYVRKRDTLGLPPEAWSILRTFL